MKQRPPADLERALGRYRGLVQRYQGTLDLMSDAGARDLDAWIGEARDQAAMVADLSPTPARLFDIGSGVGLPGLVIAACLPDLAVELVERRRRRAAFLTMAVAAAGTENAEVRQGDASGVQGPVVQVVTAQAVGSFVAVYRASAHRHDREVVLVGRKGPEGEARVRELDAALGGGARILASRPARHRGTLLAVRCPGGRACPPSG